MSRIKVRQAVIIVHGMGEQRPLDTLNGFIEVAIPGYVKQDFNPANPAYFSRPDNVTNKIESKIYLAPGKDNRYAQTEFFEYHWAHYMQGNKLTDLVSITLKMLFTLPWRVPRGLQMFWWIVWAVILLVIFSPRYNLFDLGLPELFSSISNWLVNLIPLDKYFIGVSLLIGIPALIKFLSTQFSKAIGSKLVSHFVDVVRYLDTSPRSYLQRNNIRKGMVKLLEDIHEAEDECGVKRYQRIIIVAHSLGAYIAYDGISHLWTKTNRSHCYIENEVHDSELLQEKLKLLEDAAKRLLVLDDIQIDSKLYDKNLAEYHKLQREVWVEYRRYGNPWRVTDFITMGTPMYMADRLLAENKKEFYNKIKLRQITTCPPQKDLPDDGEVEYSYEEKVRNKNAITKGDEDERKKEGKVAVIYHGAPFSVVRWTNMWFPARLRFFGDWFGGPLGDLFGKGIRDIKLKSISWKCIIPAFAHIVYFKFPCNEKKESVTKKLQTAMDLDSESWLEEFKDYKY